MMLTKTTYLTYTQCSKAFWLAEYQPHLAAAPDPAAQRRLRAGQEVDRLARAQVVWEAMTGEGETAVKQQLVEQLRAYCHLDTLAMVEIHRVLTSL